MADFRVPPLNGGERLYRALLYLYPARFRRAFTQDLIEAFRDQRRAASEHRVPRAAFSFMIVHDLITQALAERASSIVSPFRRTRSQNQEEPLMPGPLRAMRFAELRYAVRRLLRVPSFTITTVFVLALGIGTTTAMFSVVNGVLLRPLPYADPGQLVALMHTVQVAGTSNVDQSEGSLLLYQAHAQAFTGIGAWRDRDINLEMVNGQAGMAERVSSALVTANLFQVLGVPPMLGRDFRKGEDRIDAAPVVILSYRFWQNHFSGASSAIGKYILADGVSREVVGVMPRSFVFPRSAPELW
ncbi:MAG: ABC transporter permease, partial [Gemmatimonadaceae bacterium]